MLVALIVLYVGTQLASSLMMSSPTMDQTQRRIMLFMPLFFVIFIINFPAGVIVYWITTNTWTIGQQYVVKRRIGPMRSGGRSGDHRVGSAPPRGGGSDRRWLSRVGRRRTAAAWPGCCAGGVSRAEDREPVGAGYPHPRERAAAATAQEEETLRATEVA